MSKRKIIEFTKEEWQKIHENADRMLYNYRGYVTGKNKFLEILLPDHEEVLRSYLRRAVSFMIAVKELKRMGATLQMIKKYGLIR